MTDLRGRDYRIHIHHGLQGVDPLNGNVDLEVTFDDGSRYATTFFTLKNLQSLFNKNAQTGECKNGLYLWASDMVIVKILSEASISEAVVDLIAQGELEGAFSNLDSDAKSTSRPG